MFNYRKKETDIFTIKNGVMGKISLFFFTLNHPWAILQLIDNFREEQGKLEAELCTLKEQLANEIFLTAKLREEIHNLKRGQA